MLAFYSILVKRVRTFNIDMAKYFAISTFLFVFLVTLQMANSHSLFRNSSEQLNKQLDFNFNFSTIISNDLCNSHLAASQDSLERNVLWARKIRDSWGKVPSGLFSGNYFDLGNFDQCIDVRYVADDVGEITGQHCTLMIPYDLERNTETKLAAPSRS